MAQRQSPQQPASQPADPVADAAEADILDTIGAFFGDPAIAGAMNCMSLLQSGAWPRDTRGMVDEMAARYVSSRAQRDLGELDAKIKAADKAKREAADARKNREAAEKNEKAAAARKAEADAADAEAKKKADAAKAAEATAAAKIGKVR